MRNTLPLCSLPHGKSTSKILWLLAYRKNGTSAMVLHAYHAALCYETRTKRIMKAITNKTRVHEFIYALSNWSIIPPPSHHHPWGSRWPIEYTAVENHWCSRVKKWRATRPIFPGPVFLENEGSREKKFHSQFFLHVLSPSNRPSLSLSLFSSCRVARITTRLRVQQISYFFPPPNDNGKLICRENSGFNRFKRRSCVFNFCSTRCIRAIPFIRTVFRVKNSRWLTSFRKWKRLARNYRLVSIVFFVGTVSINRWGERKGRRREMYKYKW